MVMPYNWFDDNRFGIQSQMQCKASCDIPKSDLCPECPDKIATGEVGCSCNWFNNYTFIKERTLADDHLLTYPIVESAHVAQLVHNPWRAPGHAFIDSPCGVGGGNPRGCLSPDCAWSQGGYSFGPKAQNYHFNNEPFVTHWSRGDVVEVAWGITANHGGGYSYRLCKVPPEGKSYLSEECFQRTPLKFHGDKQWAQYGEDQSTRVEFMANRTSVGTFPKGSQWTKNPIPPCKYYLGGRHDHDDKCKEGLQFPAPADGLFGYGISIYPSVEPFKFSVIDKVQIPEDLEAGDYVLSFRWDCEQTPQVWNSCASIHLS